MGVHGLWRLIEPSGKPVPLETLENKILAVDISIWLHQAVKGFQDARGGQVPNAHLLGIYHRLCKLLYFRIRPVFVFDGGVPVLKKQTIAKRNQQRAKNLNDATNIQQKLISTILKHSAIQKVINEKDGSDGAPKSVPFIVPPSKDIFALPEPSSSELDTTFDSDSESESSPRKSWGDLHSIDEKSKEFTSLPAETRHDILSELKEQRKQSSWGRLHEMPKKSGDFSHFQMKRLLKRYSVQVSLDEAEKEMGGHSLSLNELEKLLNEEGIVTVSKNEGRRIASDENKQYLYIRDVKKAIDEAKNGLETIVEDQNGDEYERDLQAAITLSLQETGETSTSPNPTPGLSAVSSPIPSPVPSPDPTPSTSQVSEYEKDLQTAIKLSLETNYETDSSSDSDFSLNTSQAVRLNPAQRYMMEYADLTPYEITKLTEPKNIVVKAVIETRKEIKSSLKIAEKKKVLDVDVIEIDKSPVITSSTDIILKSPSDSDDSDFVEVSDSKKAFEVVIDPNATKDDLFDDIFTENEPEIQKQDFDQIEIVNESDKKVPSIKPNTSLDKLYKMQADLAEEQKELLSEKNLRAGLVTEEEPKVEEEIVKKIDDLDKIEIVNESDKKLPPIKPNMSLDELYKIQTELADEQRELLSEKNLRARLATDITNQMYTEAQELLELFGVPYVIAPMEAESQCAFLNMINLTDGTITDDSDIWLFGGETVYKNFFNQKKHVLEYRAERIQQYFKLTRGQMILLALLVGSDYTIGIQGIGPVTALEILSLFPPGKDIDHELLSGLIEFKNWLQGRNTPGPGRTKLRSKLQNINLSDGFPSFNVVQAYLQPEVETSEEKFTWGKPDVVGLIDYAKEKFGWTRLKSEEILKPVMKKLEDRNIQKSIRDYFAMKHKVDVSVDIAESKMSKRVKTAVNKMGKSREELKTEENESKGKKRRRKVEQDATVTTTETKKATGSKTVNSKSSKAPRKRQEKPTVLVGEENQMILNEIREENEEMNVEIIPKDVLQSFLEPKRRRRRRSEDSGPKPKRAVVVHEKETIPQRERDKQCALRYKLKAIETYRKSKLTPKSNKRKKPIRLPKEDAELSESSDSSS